jgi:hypothetical protein
MSAILTTFMETSYMGAESRSTILPYVTERELDQVWDATADGRLIAVARDGEVIAVAVPEVAEQLTSHDPDVAGELLAELREARRELRSALDIARETMAERNPGEYLYRVENALDDVRTGLDNAIAQAEELK